MKRVPIIEMVRIGKSFPGVMANEDVSFRVYPGEIHALLGENGAGKSTLMSILAGLYRPDSGYIKVRNNPVKFRSPRNALESGIGMIYQHFRLIQNFTVAENIVLGAQTGTIKLDRKQIEEETRELSERFGLEVNPSAKVNQLSLGEQQRVEILKMLYRGCDILIMDEPTTVLTPQEVSDLFKVLRKMAEQGKAVVLITHKLNEVMEIADYVTVLRKGSVVGDDRIANLDEKTLTSMMVAREVKASKVDRKSQSGDAVLEIKDLQIPADQGHIAVHRANMTIHSGEIVAIAGVAGNGQRELVEAIAGLRTPLAGDILLLGEKINHMDIRERVDMGITMVPEDRMGMGLVPNLNVMDNSILRAYHRNVFSSGPFFNYKKIRSYTNKLVKDYNIYLSDVAHPINYLSGGNLQKLLLGREIDQAPRLLVASYLVRGLDVAAAEAVYKILLEERARGTAILLVLEDLDDIFRMADRVAVMYDGQVKDILDVESTDIDKIGALMLGAEEVGVNNA
ncbi:MAG: ABC transporter ATP-binding protein [Bacillota bacterium]|nr:ABC transporter ATP-binding protein [Bacillota bacterium]